MKLIVEPSTKNNLYENTVDGLILSLKDYSVGSIVSFSLDEIKKIVKDTNIEIFININKNLMNEDIDSLSNILIELDKLTIKGIFFYDIALVKLKKELNLKTDLVWSQTHMVNNYRTCDYYYSKGVKYALLGKEITLEEIKEIVKKSKITSMVEVVSIPNVAFSKRKLLTNFYKDLHKEVNKDILVGEKVSNETYEVMEDDNGTSFFLEKITNGTSIIKDLYEINTEYIIFREYKIPDFNELLIDTKEYIKGNCLDNSYIEKYKKLGDFTNFFFKKTIFRVKYTFLPNL